jgi:PKD repeat protein
MKRLLFVLSFVFVTVAGMAQQISVQGTVTDTSGAPIPNVQVVISNIASGVVQPVGWSVTDANGSYYWIDTILGISISGPGTVGVSIFDCDSTLLNQIITFTPNTIALTANFTYCTLGTSGGGGSNCSVVAFGVPDTINPLTVQFVAQPTGTGPFTYNWDFGDGNTSTSASPIHTYSQLVNYSYCVTVTDATGCTVTYCDQIFPSNPTPCTTSYTTSQSTTNPNTYTFTSVNAGNNNIVSFWDFGDGVVDTTGFGVTSHTYTQAGLYQICLLELDITSGCLSTYCDFVLVSTGASCQATITWTNAPGSLSVDFVGTASTNNNPVSYLWDFGDGNTSTVQSPTHVYQTTATGPVTYNVSLTATDANGCVAIANETVFLFASTGSGNIMGYMWKDTFNFTPADGLVYLIEYDSIAGSLTAVDTVQTQQGFFDFQNVAAGSYLIKGALLPTDVDYATYLPTYFIQALSWSNGNFVSPTPAGLPTLLSLELIAGNNPGGAGFIGGLVVNGAGRPVTGDVTLIEDIMNEEPMEGVSVLLLDESNNAVTHTTTAADGSYSFANIAMGSYKVHVEEVGKVIYPATIVLDATNMSQTNIHFTVHENMVTLTGTYAVANVEDLQVFPNPVRDIVNLQLELKSAMNLTLTVTNLMGQQMISKPLSLVSGANSVQLEMNDLPAGLYLINLQSETDIITYRIQKL